MIRFKEIRRRHDDVHWPMQGKGKRATPPKQNAGPARVMCPYCGGSEYFATSGDCIRAGVPVAECQHPVMVARRAELSEVCTQQEK